MAAQIDSVDDAMTDDAQRLKALMHRVNIPSYRALAASAGVSRWQVQQLRAGKADAMRVAPLLRLSKSLQISLSSLLNQLGSEAENDPYECAEKDALAAAPVALSEAVAEPPTQRLCDQVDRAEYERLQEQMTQQLEAARSRFQAESLSALETWLVQWPTLAKRAKDRGDALAAEKLLPFVRPVEALVAAWGVEAIAPVDAQVLYDPQYHQLMGAVANPGERVVVTHSGAIHNGKLLHRAKVKVMPD